MRQRPLSEQLSASATAACTTCSRTTAGSPTCCRQALLLVTTKKRRHGAGPRTHFSQPRCWANAMRAGTKAETGTHTGPRQICRPRVRASTRKLPQQRTIMWRLDDTRGTQLRLLMLCVCVLPREESALVGRKPHPRSKLATRALACFGMKISWQPHFPSSSL